MKLSDFHNSPPLTQYAWSMSAVLLCAGVSYLIAPITGYRMVGYLLLISVSLIAMVFDIRPVLTAAALSALIWDFFFIPPRFTLHVGGLEDTILLSLYFIIAMVNAALTYKLRSAEKAMIVREEKEKTLKLYNTVLNSLSHELRTPIATIMAATDNLKTTSEKLSVQQRADLLAEISKASVRLNEQVENLLNMSRLESAYLQPHKDWCDINELVYESVSKLEEQGMSQTIVIELAPELPLFQTDKGMVQQILFNLLHNASLYTPPNSTVTLTGRCQEDLLELTVADNGPGFPADEINKVFDKFYRLKHSRTGGTGLGLSIVRGFTEALGGHILLTNQAQGGACFRISLPGETSFFKHVKHEQG